MREIKFRAWDYTNEEMVSVIGIRQWGTTEIEVENKERDTYVIEDEEEFETMQYIGIKDKNGVEIFEGDIFKTRNGVVAVVEYDENNGRFLGFTIKKERKIVYIGQEPAVEVIGNIHQNISLDNNSGF